MRIKLGVGTIAAAALLAACATQSDRPSQPEAIVGVSSRP